MIEIEFRITSERREGLLLEIGRVVAACGFTLQRPRLTKKDERFLLTVVVTGPQPRLSDLENRLAGHPLVVALESNAPAQAPAAPAPAAQVIHEPPIVAGTERDRIEALLPTLAQDYPKVLDRLQAFDRSLAPAQREAAMLQVGTRLGAWVYKRDYSLGARLNLADSTKHIALPAIRQLLRDVELAERGLRIHSSPFCTPPPGEQTCHFLRGYFEGLLNEPGHLQRVRVSEPYCRSAGAEYCMLAFDEG